MRRSGGTLEECCLDYPPPGPGLVADWCDIRAAAMAARALQGFNALHLRPWNKTLPEYDPGWFAGPDGTSGWESVKPVELRLSSEWGQVELELVVHWSPWRSFESPERNAIEAGIARLESESWA